MNFKNIIIFLQLITYNLAEQTGICTREVTLNDIPSGTLSQLLIILFGYSLGFSACKEISNQKNSIKYYLYTRKHVNEPILLNSTNLHEIDSTKRVIFQIHGWLCSSRDSGMPEMKNAYLLRYDANVIIVDWSELSTVSNSESICAAPRAAELFGNFLCKMQRLRNVKLESIHLVGQSLGAQLAGLTGQVVKKMCGSSIGRITGLDPAGSYYQNVSIDKRLDASDANMVDVIHTDMGVLGYNGTCGTIDFFVNGGVFQPGCSSLAYLTSIPDVQNLYLYLFTCSHGRSLDYMTESIVRPLFIAQRCDLCPGTPLFIRRCTPNTCPPWDTILMGEDCPRRAPGSKYYVTTNSRPPFAQGYNNKL